MAPAATLKLLHIDLEVLTTQIANEREALSPKKVLHRIARSSASSSTKYGLTHFEDLVYEDLCLVRTSVFVRTSLPPTPHGVAAQPSCSIRCAFALRPSGGTNRETPSLPLPLLLLQTVHPGHWSRVSCIAPL